MKIYQQQTLIAHTRPCDHVSSSLINCLCGSTGLCCRWEVTHVSDSFFERSPSFPVSVTLLNVTQISCFVVFLLLRRKQKRAAADTR